MPLTLPFRAVFAASTVALSCCACLLALLKSVLRAECSAPYTGGSSLRPVVIACVVAAALCLVASTAHLVKSRAWTQAAALCSKWQPVYLVIMSVQRLVLRAVVAYAVGSGSGRAGSCVKYENAVHAVSLMWSCAVLMAALSAMCGDTDAQLPPALRRCAYGLLALVLLLDGIGSVVWGNLLASDVSIAISDINVFLDYQLTSTIASQAVIALHFVYVSCRSRRGRGWAYASLRFELDECGRSVMNSMSMPMVASMTASRKESGLTASASSPMLAPRASARAQLQHAAAARWHALSRLRQRWLQFQQRQVSRCRSFIIPCVTIHSAGGGSEAVFALERPAFDFKWLRPLQRLAYAHPRLYIGFMFFFLAVPSITCAMVLKGKVSGIADLVLNSLLLIMGFGFLSNKRYGLDRVAVKHVALSFRFAIFVTLLASNVALDTRQVYTNDRDPTAVVAIAFAMLLFCMCILFDCSPHLPPSVQIYISVNACYVAYQRVC
jgi:hypothetical protein